METEACDSFYSLWHAFLQIRILLIQYYAYMLPLKFVVHSYTQLCKSKNNDENYTRWKSMVKKKMEINGLEKKKKHV